MKKTLLLIAMMLCCATTIFAQNNRISYQAVVRDTANRLVANKTVTVTVNIFNGDAQTAAYTETHTNVQTNYNGLFSLQMGNGTNKSGDWNDIHWKNARVTTAVSLDGTELATLNMPLTAVPYALYADYAEEINPDAVVVTEIYEKMLADSNALAGQITNLDSKLTSKIYEDSVALAGQITTLNTNLTSKIYEDSLALAGQINDVNANLIDKIYTDSLALRTLINTNISDISNLKAADNALSTRIANDSAYLRNNYTTTTDLQSNYYNRTQTNTLLGAKADTGWVYTRTIIDNKLATKANAADVYTKSQVYTKTETDNLLNGYVTKNGLCTEVVTCVDNALSNGSSTTNKAIDTIAANITLDILSNGHYVSTSDCPTQDVSICDLVSTVNELTNTIGNLNSAIAGLQSSINDLNEQNAALSERVTELENEMASVVTGKVINLDTLTHDITLTDGYTVTGTLAHNVKITIADDATVTLDGVNINGNGTYTGDHAGITCESDATIILAHGTTNTVKGFHEDYPGIYVPAYPAGSTLTIKGSGSLLASSNGDNAAGIGGGNGATRSCGNIRIEEGTVMATGGAYAAGIGGGKDSDCDDIVIINGVTSVKATKGSNASNSIGAGTGTSKCDGVTFGNTKVYNGTAWDPNPMVSGTYGGLDLTISGNDWTLTEAGSQDPVIEASTFQKCYDCWREPDYPTQGNTQCKFFYFANPGIGNNTSAGPWKLEYKGSYSSNQNPYNISVGSYQSTYSVVDVPIFELLQWDGSSFQHAAYGVVCAYSSVNNQIDHTAFFEADNYWGCYLTGAEHSEDLYITFDEYLSDGLHSLIPQP